MLTPMRILVSLVLAIFAMACGGSSQYTQSRPGSSGGSRGFAVANAPSEMEEVSYNGDDDDSDGGSYDDYEAAPVSASRASSMGMAPTSKPSSGKSAPTAQPITPTTPPKTSGPKPATDAKRPMLIYRATINLAVFEARKSIDEVEALAKSLGGYLVQRSDSQITIRVPAGAFDNALETVAKVGDELHRQVQVQDVTAEFRDMQIRLKNLQAVRERLAALLDRAKTVEEALRVERELERVSGNIESIKGKLKLFSELVAFSTITVNFQARPAESLSSEVNLPFPWLNRLGLSRLLDLN